MAKTNPIPVDLAVIEAIAKETQLLTHEVTPDSHLQRFLVDESTLAVLCLELETRLEIDIPDGLFNGFLTVRDVMDRVGVLTQSPRTALN